MSDYISREETLKRLCKDVCNVSDCQCDEIRCEEWFVIHDAPASDVRPVVRGEWVVSRTDYGWNCAEFPTHCKCTVCGREVPYQDKDNFCPNCGADMREES